MMFGTRTYIRTTFALLAGRSFRDNHSFLPREKNEGGALITKITFEHH